MHHQSRKWLDSLKLLRNHQFNNFNVLMSIWAQTLFRMHEGKPMKTEVLVAGAGPVGLTMAAELARYGVSVRIVEKARQRSDKSRAIAIWSRTLELLDRAACGSNFIAAGIKVTAANVVSGGRTIAKIELAGVPSPHPFALMLPQSETERLLEEHLNGLGVEVERGVEITSFNDDRGVVTSIVHRADGTEEEIQSGWLIGCDGAHSTVRHGLRMVFSGDTQPSNWLLADVQLEGLQNPGEIQVGWHSEGVLVILPIKHDRFRVIADLGASQMGQGQKEIRLWDVQSVLDKRGVGRITALQPSWLASFHINERMVENYQSGRILLAGDAAHVHSPAGGQGMNTGMQDAFNLAWKLALVCRGICAEEPLLESYSSERKKVGELVLKNASRITSLAILRGEVMQSLRNHFASILFGFSPVRDAMAESFTELSIGYPDSPLNGRGPHSHGGPAEGERAPIIDGQRPIGSGNAPRFALCADLSEPGARHGAAVLAGLYRNLLEEEIRPPFASGGTWLVRPDGYVAFSTRKGAWDDVAAYLDRLARVR
jgi:2-polyprenyl-6-methoxyphenol hydroxylase-like FAD-dependent oxidoreductase